MAPLDTGSMTNILRLAEPPARGPAPDTADYADLGDFLRAVREHKDLSLAQLADATLRPDGSLEPIHNYHGLGSLETHPTPKLDVYAYYGGEYAQRTVYTTPQGALIGYGPRNLNDSGCYALPANSGNGSGTAGSLSAVTCASPTRYIQEGMLGFTYRLASSPKYGRLQYQATYQYVQRNLWSGTATTAGLPTTGPRAVDNMIHMGMRYYIP